MLLYLSVECPVGPVVSWQQPGADVLQQSRDHTWASGHAALTEY